jgi:hypothetical protein
MTPRHSCLVSYLGIDVDNALAIAEQADVSARLIARRVAFHYATFLVPVLSPVELHRYVALSALARVLGRFAALVEIRNPRLVGNADRAPHKAMGRAREADRTSIEAQIIPVLCKRLWTIGSVASHATCLGQAKPVMDEVFM